MNRKKYALIGYPLAHSISPFMHKALFEFSGISADYEIIEIKPGNLSESIELLSKLDGYNITIPHKTEIISFLDYVDSEAALIGAVNTAVKQENGFCGYNTDILGFEKALEINGIPLKGSVCISGCGGTAKTASYAALKKGCKLTFCVREESTEKAKKLCRSLNIKDACVCTASTLSGKFDLLVNTTPVGMYPDKGLCADEKILKSCNAFFDAVYNPLETPSVKLANRLEVKACSGLLMLVFQAVYAHKLWYGGSFKDSDIKDLYIRCKDKINNEFK